MTEVKTEEKIVQTKEMMVKKCYKISGCDESEEDKNGIYMYDKTTGDGCIWWRKTGLCSASAFLRYSPPWGGCENGSWEMGWYNTRALCRDDPGVLIPPKTGWKFNGGWSDPSSMGDKIVVEECECVCV